MTHKSLKNSSQSNSLQDLLLRARFLRHQRIANQSHNLSTAHSKHDWNEELSECSQIRTCLPVLVNGVFILAFSVTDILKWHGSDLLLTLVSGNHNGKSNVTDRSWISLQNFDFNQKIPNMPTSLFSSLYGWSNTLIHSQFNKHLP